ncbi:MAG: hypothetical protein H7067_15340 [Burkholderiales bacterium]|nr:hypothetical protein [Opitutaceae bacterium]
MSINRTLLLQGPGFITFAGASIHSETDITATLIEEWSDSVSSGFGRTGRKLLDRRVEVVATPTMWMNLSVLFPYATLQIGDPLFGAVDVPLVITPRNGRPLTVLNVAITTLANLKCSAADSLFKSGITWTGLCANNTSPGDLANFFTQGAVGTNVLLTGFDKTKVFKSRYTGLRNAVTLRSDKGFDIDFAMQATGYRPDGEATAQFYLQSLEASAGVVPVALAESAYLSLLNDDVDIGGEAPLFDLVVASEVVGHPTITLAKTMVEPGGFAYGGNPRNAALKFQTVREPATSVLPALWTIGVIPAP